MPDDRTPTYRLVLTIDLPPEWDLDDMRALYNDYADFETAVILLAECSLTPEMFSTAKMSVITIPPNNNEPTPRH